MSAARKPAEHYDPGPRIRHKRGDVAVASVPDPDNPNRTIRRANVLTHYRLMGLPAHQLEAAMRLEVQAERAGGARWRPDSSGVRLAPWQTNHPAEWQLAAIRDLVRVRTLLAPEGEAVVWAVIVRNTPISALATGGHQRATLRTQLGVALQQLADMWGID